MNNCHTRRSWTANRNYMDEYSLKVRNCMVDWYVRGFVDPWSEKGGPTTWGRVEDNHKVKMVL